MKQKALKILDNEIHDFETREQIKKELWNNIVFAEFNEIYKQIKPKKRNPQIYKEILQKAESANKAGKIWNKKFQGFYLHKGKIYFIKLYPSQYIYFRQYNVENFLKGINELIKKRPKLLEKLIEPFL
jgi:hypothetical protein